MKAPVLTQPSKNSLSLSVINIIKFNVSNVFLLESRGVVIPLKEKHNCNCLNCLDWVFFLDIKSKVEQEKTANEKIPQKKASKATI